MKELDLKKYLSKYKDTNVDFFRFAGNYGDSLIWHGTKKLLSSLNITEHYVDISSPKYNNVLLIDGGGNLVDYYSDVRNFFYRLANKYFFSSLYDSREVIAGISDKLRSTLLEMYVRVCPVSVLTSRLAENKIAP